MRRILLIAIAIFCVETGFAQQHTSDPAIDKVLNSFMRSIIQKDTVTLYSLFAVNVPIGWIEADGMATVVFYKKKNPAAKVLTADTHTNFIRYVGTTKDAVEEKFYNVKLRKNDNLASVSFDYSFWENKKKANWGQENWELVFDGTDWKIAGIYYSYELESVTPEPKRN